MNLIRTYLLAINCLGIAQFIRIRNASMCNWFKRTALVAGASLGDACRSSHQSPTTLNQDLIIDQGLMSINQSYVAIKAFVLLPTRQANPCNHLFSWLFSSWSFSARYIRNSMHGARQIFFSNFTCTCSPMCSLKTLRFERDSRSSEFSMWWLWNDSHNIASQVRLSLYKSNEHSFSNPHGAPALARSQRCALQCSRRVKCTTLFVRRNNYNRYDQASSKGLIDAA